MIPVDAIRHVAVVGAGTVGASWTAYFLSRNMQVSVYDPDLTKANYVARYVDECWPILQKLGAVSSARQHNWTFYTDLAKAVANAEFVQESAPDHFDTKCALFADLDRLIPPETIIASSTSSLLMSDMQRSLATKARFLVAHPFNPPHLIPIVELVGGRATSLAALDWCSGFFEHHGKTILRLKKEVIGHIINRLQAALFQEAICLVRDGVAEISDIDRGIAFGPAIRWVLMGPFLTFHLGARHGIRAYLNSLGPAHQRMWRDLGQVHALDSALVDQISLGVDQETFGASESDLLAQRDSLLAQLVIHFRHEQRRLVQ